MGDKNVITITMPTWFAIFILALFLGMDSFLLWTKYQYNNMNEIDVKIERKNLKSIIK